MIRGGQGLAVIRHRRPVGEKAEILGAANGGLRHETPALAGVQAFDGGDFLRPGLDEVGDFVQDGFAPVAGSGSPFREGRLGGGDGQIELGFGGIADGADGFAGRRFADREDLAGTGEGLAVHEMAQGCRHPPDGGQSGGAARMRHGEVSCKAAMIINMLSNASRTGLAPAGLARKR